FFFFFFFVYAICFFFLLILPFQLVEELTREERNVIVSAFRELDENGDGVLDRSELSKFLRRTGLSAQEVKKRTDELMKILDRDGDGVIDLNEFMTSGASWRLSTDENFIEKQFRGNVLICFHSLSSSLWNHFIMKAPSDEIAKAFNGTLDDDEIQKIVAEVDTNRDGKVSLEEFRIGMREHMFSGNSQLADDIRRLSTHIQMTDQSSNSKQPG
ncbi:calcium-dependent protein kinase 4, partial [Reticulomyxa filosa]